MKQTIKALLLLFVILSTACKKDFEATQEKTILLTKPSGWLTLKVEEKSANGSWVDVTGVVSPLDQDNLLIFDPFFSWAIDEGKLKIPGNPQVLSHGKWNFVDDASKIQIVGGNLMEIIELTQTTLITHVTVNNVTQRYTFGHP